MEANMFKFLQKLLTKNRTEIPLIFINFNYQKYKESGKIGSCMTHFHPMLRNDKKLEGAIGLIIDYVRENYDMEKM
jgi:transcription elongation factor GreA-like protein